MKKVFYLLLIALLAFSFSCKKAKEWKTIKIGIIGPMKFVQGKGHWNGAIMAAEEVNEAGGIKVGDEMRKVELVKADSNEILNVIDATNAMDRLVNKDKVDFILGGLRTEAVLAMQEIAMNAKKIFMGYGAAHPELCLRVAKNYNRYKYFFRGSPINNRYLVKNSLMQLGMVAAALRKITKLKKLKVAVVVEKAKWGDVFVSIAKSSFPPMGLEIIGVWRPSAVATNLNAEISAIQRKGAHIIYNIFSASVGITFARQVGELKLPVIRVGINVEEQKSGFWKATQGKGNYGITSSTYARGVHNTDITIPFIEKYFKKYGEYPTYTASTYGAIKILLKTAIEATGSTDPEKLIPFMEKTKFKTEAGHVFFMKDEKGNNLHDLAYGPGYMIGTALQWVDGKMYGIWPYKTKFSKDGPVITYEGTVPIKVPPWMIKKYKK